jgi:hypothetical protein
LARRSRQGKHARELGLLGRDVLIPGRLHVPLGKPALALEDGNNIGEVRSRLALLRRRAWAPSSLAVRFSLTTATTSAAIVKGVSTAPSVGSVFVIPSSFTPV